MALGPLEYSILSVLGTTLAVLIRSKLKSLGGFIKALQRLAIELKRLRLIVKAPSVEEAEAILRSPANKQRRLPPKT